MGMNGVDQAVSQQMAVALTEGAASQLQDLTEKEYTKKADEKSSVKKALDAKSLKEASNKVLSDLVSKLASSGIKLDANTLTTKLRGNAKDEYDLMLKGDNDNSDSVSIKSSKSAIEAAKRARNQNRSGSNSGKDAPMDTGKMKAAIEEYTAACIQFTVSGGQEIKKKMEQLEARLKAEGASINDILNLKQSLKNQIRSAIASQLKETAIKKLLSDRKSIDWMLATRELHEVFGKGQHNARLGGWDFGGYNTHLQGTLDKSIDEAKGEIRQFMAEELEKSIVAKHLGNDSVDKDIQELIKLGQKLGFNFKEFSKNWTVKKFDLGFVPVPDNMPNMQANTQDNSRGGYGGYDYNQDDEKEILINQLRALYMRRAIKGDIRTVIETSFKIRKLKNGMIKLGIQFGDFEKIEKEGAALARLRVMDMLREALYERATLYQLAGPAFKLNAKKIKGLMKNLERLGIELSTSEFNALKDDANRRMFDTAKEELERVMIMRQTNRAPALEKKEKLLVKLMKRLREESGIRTEILPAVEISAIKEAA